MRYAFAVDAREGYLHVRVEGDNTPDTIRRYLNDVVAACARLKCGHVLIEERLEGPRLSMGEIFAIVQERSESFRPTMRLVAYVDVNAGGSPNMKFAEDVAVNRGVSMGLFGAVADAEKWLRRKIAAAPPPAGPDAP